MDSNDARIILGVTAKASQEEIKRAYRSRTRLVHADRFPPDSLDFENASKMMRDLNEAYGILKLQQQQSSPHTDTEKTQREQQRREQARQKQREREQTQQKQREYRKSASKQVAALLVGVVIVLGAMFLVVLGTEYQHKAVNHSARQLVEPEVSRSDGMAHTNLTLDSRVRTTLVDFLRERLSLFPEITYERDFVILEEGGDISNPVTGEKILKAPYVREIWGSLGYMADYTLYDFDNDGIPEIVVEILPTFSTGGGFPNEIYKYDNDEYRLLGRVSTPTFFQERDGQIIVFALAEYEYAVSRMILKNEGIIVENLADGNDFEISDFAKHNPTLYSNLKTPLTEIKPLSELKNIIHEHVKQLLLRR